MGKASTAKRKGKPTGAEDQRVVLWAVLLDGQLGSQLFGTAADAELVARALREEHPASTVEWAQVGLTVLMRRPLRPKIERARAIVTP